MEKQTFYYGYVYDIIDKKPLKNVLVKTSIVINPRFIKTDSTGYFKLHKQDELINDLIFIEDNYKTDTIPTVWSQHGEKLEYHFLNEIPDTVYLKRIK